MIFRPPKTLHTDIGSNENSTFSSSSAFISFKSGVALIGCAILVGHRFNLDGGQVLSDHDLVYEATTTSADLLVVCH